MPVNLIPNAFKSFFGMIAPDRCPTESRPATRLRTRLGAEELEPRWVPIANFLWSPPNGSDQLWTTPGNWQVYDKDQGLYVQQNAAYPGQNPQDPYDRAEFIPSTVLGGRNRPCTLTQAVTVHRVNLETGYTATLYLKAPLTISGNGGSVLMANGQEVQVGVSSFRMADQTTVQGHRPSGEQQGTLVLAGGSQFYWLEGTLYDITVDIQRTSSAKYATATVHGLDEIKQQNATLSVTGKLIWDSGDVQVPEVVSNVPKSMIQITPQGRFEITTNGTWGSSDPARLKVENSGTVEVTLNTAATKATLVADYDNYGMTRINKGILEIVGAAEQAATGTTELRGAAPPDATIRVLGNGQVLGIRGGVIRGTGTVDANLHLKNQNGTGAGTIAPGIDTTAPVTRGIGEIAVTQSLHIWSANARTEIDLSGSGAIDKVTITGYAALGGALVVSDAATWNPANGTIRTFLTAAGGVLPNLDFATKQIAPQRAWFHPGTPFVYLHWKLMKRANAYDIEVVYM